MRPTLLLSLAAASLALLACGKDGPEADSGEGESELQYFTGTTGSETDDGGCAEVTVDYDGEEPPHVGTTWTLFPRCDGALIMGAVVIRVDPVECATLDENLITFDQAGICEISIQVGSEFGTLAVDVLE